MQKLKTQGNSKQLAKYQKTQERGVILKMVVQGYPKLHLFIKALKNKYARNINQNKNFRVLEYVQSFAKMLTSDRNC